MAAFALDSKTFPSSTPPLVFLRRTTFIGMAYETVQNDSVSSAAELA